MRLLNANEIECRVATVKENGFSLLLYKSARVDMQMLDEEYGAMNWKRKHELIGDRLYCTISVYNKETGQWIDKQDVGTESYTEKEKGQASDSFKRAGFNWNIGRELYTAPFIWVNNEGDVQKGSNGKLYVNGSFSVSEIGYDSNRNINHLVIVDGKGKVRFTMASKSPQSNNKPQAKEQVKEVPKEPVKGNESLVCSGCGTNITGKVADYSTEKYGKALCMACQKGVK